MQDAMRKIGRLVLAFAAMHAAAPASAEVPWPVALRGKVVLVNEISFRLRSAVLPSFCRHTSPALGAEFDDITNYATRDRAAIRTVLGITDQPQVAAVAPGSPAAEAGLSQGDDIMAIGDSPVTQLSLSDRDGRTRSDLIHDKIVDALSAGPVRLTVRHAGQENTITVAPLRLCSAHANVTTARNINAHEGGSEIAVSTGLIDFALNSNELALILAHEFSHSFLDHDKATSIAQRRAMERQADLVGAMIARCAGYDAQVGAAFWPRFGARDAFSWLRAPTHEKPAARARNILAALAETAPPCPLSR